MSHQPKLKSQLINKPIYVTLEQQKRFQQIARRYPVSCIPMEKALTYLESLNEEEKRESLSGFPRSGQEHPQT